MTGNGHVVRTFCAHGGRQSWRVLLSCAQLQTPPTRARALLLSLGMTTTTHDSVKPILSLTAVAFLTATLLALLALMVG
jgi:hypothetical protein